MIRHKLFEQAFSRIKDFLPDIEIRNKVQKILQDCDILTQEEMEKHVQQIDRLKAKLQDLEERIEKLEKK